MFNFHIFYLYFDCLQIIIFFIKKIFRVSGFIQIWSLFAFSSAVLDPPVLIFKLLHQIEIHSKKFVYSFGFIIVFFFSLPHE